VVGLLNAYFDSVIPVLGCHPGTGRVLLGSRLDLPYRAARKHLGPVSE
jgi:hypothetical protein